MHQEAQHFTNSFLGISRDTFEFFLTSSKNKQNKRRVLHIDWGETCGDMYLFYLGKTIGDFIP